MKTIFHFKHRKITKITREKTNKNGIHFKFVLKNRNTKYKLFDKT